MEMSAQGSQSLATKSLRIARVQSVAEVTLVGPGRSNTMGPDFWRELPIVFAQLDADPAVRAIVVRGSGGNFSYGLDLPSMGVELSGYVTGEQLALSRTKLLDVIRTLQDAITSVAKCSKPVIAAVSGWCIGGGLDLAAACDIRLCSQDAKFSLREVRVAMVADIGSLQRLPTIIGEGNTRELAFTGKDIDAARALRMGLVGEVYESEEKLFEQAQDMAKSIANNAPLVVQGIKRVMNHGVERRVSEGLDYVAVWNAAMLPSKDLLEAMAAFVQKRPPSFRGE